MNELKMATNQKTLDVAIAVKPLMVYLNKVGVISVDGASVTPHIQLSARKFREIWPDVTPDSDGVLHAMYDGTLFTAWERVNNG